LLLEIQLNENKDLLKVGVDGDIDVNSVRQLKKSLEENIEEYKPNIVIDCEKLNYIDSTGLGVLVSALKKVQKYDGTIKITALKPYLSKIFEVTGLTQLFDIEVAN
jgi:anti-sigma B factor antagonist